MEKTKIMTCSKNLHSIQDSGKCPSGVCCKGDDRNPIFCDGCQSWIHKKPSGFKSWLKADPKYRCKRCMGLCRPVDGRPEKHVTLEGIQLDDVVESFYLDDKICLWGGCKLATIAWIWAAWEKFCELLPHLTSTTISLVRHGKLYDSLSEILYFMLANVGLCGEKKSNTFCITNVMLDVKDKSWRQQVSLPTMHGQLNFAPLESKLKLNCLRQYGHVERSDKWTNRCIHLKMDGF